MAGPGQHFPMASRGSLPPSQMMPPQQSMGGYMPPASQIGPIQGPGMPGPGPGGPAGIQHQQSFPGPGPTTMPHGQPQMTSPTKMVNAVAVCKRGQETNQDLMNKVLDIFRQFKQLQLPNGTNNQIFQEKRIKIEDGLKQLNTGFKMLRAMYDKVNELVPDDPDEPAEEVLVAIKGEEIEKKNTNTDVYRHVSEDHQQIIEQIRQRNQQIKEIIDKIRTIMWEINTMIVMRKT